MNSFGRTTITFVTVTEDVNDLDEFGKPALIRTPTDVTGCHFRPLPATEKYEPGNIVVSPWKATCPPVAAAMNAKATDEVVVDGVTYQIVGGPRVFGDLNGRPFKVTVIAQRITG
ncbi:Uncharacterised protein [Mycobacteroides abscessus subsp. abscessus]|nr:Uncharacterised protein [Mycobacteroides abscessus subsp. abscessus]